VLRRLCVFGVRGVEARSRGEKKGEGWVQKRGEGGRRRKGRAAARAEGRVQKDSARGRPGRRLTPRRDTPGRGPDDRGHKGCGAEAWAGGRACVGARAGEERPFGATDKLLSIPHFFLLPSPARHPRRAPSRTTTTHRATAGLDARGLGRDGEGHGDGVWFSGRGEKKRKTEIWVWGKFAVRAGEVSERSACATRTIRSAASGGRGLVGRGRSSQCGRPPRRPTARPRAGRPGPAAPSAAAAWRPRRPPARARRARRARRRGRARRPRPF
jgi:hypothetical protein